jgi:hypothetical protein
MADTATLNGAYFDSVYLLNHSWYGGGQGTFTNDIRFRVSTAARWVKMASKRVAKTCACACACAGLRW